MLQSFDFWIFAFTEIISKITVNRKKIVSARDIFLANLWDFGKFLLMVVFKVFSTSKSIFKVKLTNIASIDITLMSLLQYLDTFLSTLFTWTIRSSRLEDSKENMILKIPQNLQENICVRVSFAIKLQAAGLQLD